MSTLDGMVAIVTGAARGQGEAEARLLAEHGARVVLTDVLAEQGAAVAADIGRSALFVTQDVSEPEGWDEVVAAATQAFGRVDILINNAAIAPPLKLEATEPEVFNEVYRVNQFGVYLGMRAVLAPMRAAGGGSIVNISSVAGLKGSVSLFAYGATKWAVRGMTKGAAQELGPYGVRVNSIHPGIIDTAMIADLPLDEMATRVPLRRYASPDEVAKLALWLASDDSAYATGAEFVLDGGMTA